MPSGRPERSHLHDVAASNSLGIDPARAWAWPAVLDLFYLASELLILRASYLRAVDGWAIVLTAIGALGSIGLNVAGVGEHAPFLQYVVAAVPPVAALLAFGALMRQLHVWFAHREETPVETPLTSVDMPEATVAVERLADEQPPMPPLPPGPARAEARPAAPCGQAARRPGERPPAADRGPPARARPGADRTAADPVQRPPVHGDPQAVRHVEKVVVAGQPTTATATMARAERQGRGCV